MLGGRGWIYDTEIVLYITNLRDLRRYAGQMSSSYSCRWEELVRFKIPSS